MSNQSKRIPKKLPTMRWPLFQNHLIIDNKLKAACNLIADQHASGDEYMLHKLASANPLQVYITLGSCGWFWDDEHKLWERRYEAD